MIKKLLISIFLLCFAVSAWGATYYISDTTDPSEDGSVDHPFDTFSDWEAVAANSDVVYLAKGDSWDEQLDIDVNDVTIDAYGSGADPIIAGASVVQCIDITGTGTTIQNIALSGGSTVQIKINAGANDTAIDYVDFGAGVDGVRIISTGNATTDNIDITNSTFTSLSSEGIAIMLWDGDDNAAEIIYDVNITGNTFTSCGNAVEIWANEQVDVDPGLDGDNTASRSIYNFIFDNNTVTGCTDAGIVILSGLKDAGSGNYIRDNTFTNSGGATQSNVNTIQAQWVRNLEISGNTFDTMTTDTCDGGHIILDYAYTDEDNYSEDVTIKQNIITGAEGTGCEGAGIILFRSKNGIVANNLIYGNDAGIRINLVGAANTGNVIYNNTIANNTNDGIRINANSLATTIKNNIISGNGAEGIDDDSTNDPTASYNLYYNTGADYSGFTSGGNDQTTDPLFVSSTNFHLQSTSPVKTAGTPLGSTYATDLNGNSRADCGWSMGAFAYCLGKKLTNDSAGATLDADSAGSTID